MKFGLRRADWLLLTLSVTCLVLGWAFAKFGSEVTEGELTGLDAAIRRFAQAHQSPIGSSLFNAVTMLGSKPVLVVVGVAVGWWLSSKSKTLVLLLALCGMVSAEFVGLLKVGFGVVRPPAGVLTSSSLAFPSGHVAGAAAIATLLCYVSWRRKKAVRFVIPISVLLVGLMAASRVYLDKHWTSDTLGGGLIGMSLGFACAALYEWITLRHLEA